jgi:RNA polymerase sigma-70 factor (ECF subfamily)
LDDFELFRKIKLRERSAFDTLFRKYYTRLCRFSCAFCLSQEDAEESIQEMFIHLWEKAPVINVDTSVKAYLYTSARNHTLNLMTGQRTELRYRSEYSELASDDGHDERLSDTEISELIGQGVKVLPEKCREIFILCKQEGLTYEEIATWLNVSEKTVENQMGIALHKLRDFLRPKLQKMLLFLFFTYSFGGNEFGNCQRDKE